MATRMLSRSTFGASRALLLRSNIPSAAVRFQSSSSTDPTTQEVVKKEEESEARQALTRARPEGEVVAAGVVSGAPEEVFRRSVTIFKPTRPTEQSAEANVQHWRVNWDILPGSSKYENPLMGWAASADYMQGTHFKFNSKEEAITFCEKQGYDYHIQEPKRMKFKPKSYSNNFLHQPGKLRLIQTK